MPHRSSNAGELFQVMEHCKGGDLFKTLMMKGGSLDEHWVCTEVINRTGTYASAYCLIGIAAKRAVKRILTSKYCVVQIIAPLLRVLIRMHKDSVIHRYERWSSPAFYLLLGNLVT